MLCSVPLQPLQDAFLAEDVVACGSDWTPEDPLAYGADQIIVWGVHKQLHVIAPTLCWHLWVSLDVANINRLLLYSEVSLCTHGDTNSIFSHDSTAATTDPQCVST